MEIWSGHDNGWLESPGACRKRSELESYTAVIIALANRRDLGEREVLSKLSGESLTRNEAPMRS